MRKKQKIYLYNASKHETNMKQEFLKQTALQN